MKKLLFILLLLLAGPLAMAQPKQITAKEFLKLSVNDTTSYVLKGVVSNVRYSSRGSFDLTDNTGTVYVYGLIDPSDPGKSFSQLEIVRGDTLTVQGRFTIYNGTTKEMKDGRLLARADGPDHNKSFYDRLDQKPSFKGKEGMEGLAEFRNWVQSHLKKPADGATGSVKVRFVVGRNGKVQEVQVDKGATPSLNDEAVRVVRSSPRWKPAISEGTPIRYNCFVVVVFD